MRAFPRLLTAGVIVAIGLLSTARADDLAKARAADRKGDYAKELRLLKPLADRGHAEAQLQLGFMYLNSRGVPGDGAQAVNCFRLAAGRGDARAAVWAEAIAAERRGDDSEAFRLLRSLADRGDAQAQFRVAINAFQDQAVQRDDARLALAVKYSRLAASRGDVRRVIWAEAIATKNYATEFKLLKPLADAGDALAQRFVAVMYFFGEGVSQDDGQEARYYLLAASQGDGRAQDSLADIYDQGLGGVPKDDVQAYKWANLAAAQGVFQAAQRRDEIASRMTPTKITQAETLSREWKPE